MDTLACIIFCTVATVRVSWTRISGEDLNLILVTLTRMRWTATTLLMSATTSTPSASPAPNAISWSESPDGWSSIACARCRWQSGASGAARWHSNALTTAGRRVWGERRRSTAKRARVVGSPATSADSSSLRGRVRTAGVNSGCERDLWTTGSQVGTAGMNCQGERTPMTACE